MSAKNRRIRRRRAERSSLQILEEAFHLLRRVDARAWLWFFAGAAPFAVAMLYFAADMSRSGLAGRSALAVSAAAVAFYFWMRYCQTRFCALLWEKLSPGHLPERGTGERFRAAAAAMLLHALHVPLLAIGIFFALPLGWILAMQQNFCVIAATQPLGDRPLGFLFSTSARLSHHDWAQNHGILLIVAVVGFFVWVNLVGSCLILPGFAKSFFGVESVFTISPTVAITNSTFVFGTLLLTWLVLSPLMKAAYTLRCFYAESRRTGADLLSRLASIEEDRASRSGEAPQVGSVESGRLRKNLAGFVGVALLLSLGQSAAAQDSDAVPPALSERTGADDLRGAIDETMEQKKYQWQLSRRITGEEVDAEKSWLQKRIGEIAEATRDAIDAIGEWLDEMLDKLFKKKPNASGGTKEVDTGWFEDLRSLLSFGLVVLVAALLGWLGWLLYQRNRGKDAQEEGGEIEGGIVDLRSEEIVATQLPEQEWMRLAREQMSRGDGRLAVRALFLATLALLGEQGLLRIERHKSNRDYRDELGRRARKATRLREAFDENTRLFERAWYGWHSVSPETVEEFLSNHQAIGEEAPTASRKRSVANV